MNYAIIAAGEGSRLAEEGVKQPKPLVTLNGLTLLDRLIGIFLKNNAESISLIINGEMKEVQEHVSNIRLDIPFHIVVRSTPSSMHSFFELSRFLQTGKFCLTTVDTIFKEKDFEAYIRAFETDTEYDGMMAVTSFVDDEKPLYVETDGELNITGFLDKTGNDRPFVSGGIYCLSADKAIPCLRRCMEEGIHRMRNYQRRLVSDNLKLKAYPFPKIIDVDHAEDIQKAESFLNQ